MKISQKQASLLAREVLNQLTRLKTGEVHAQLLDRIKTFREKRDELKQVCDAHNSALRKHEGTWKSLVGLTATDRIFYGDTLEEITKKLRERQVPSLQRIEDEIILGAMFASDEDMESFVNKIVKKFDKKTKSKVLSN